MSVQILIVKKFVPLIVFSGACMLAFVVAKAVMRAIGFAHSISSSAGVSAS